MAYTFRVANAGGTWAPRRAGPKAAAMPIEPEAEGSGGDHGRADLGPRHPVDEPEVEGRRPEPAPRTTPTVVTIQFSRRKWRTMAALGAPRARRVPICRRRSATEKEVSPTIPRAVTSTSRAMTPLSEDTSMRSRPWYSSRFLDQRAEPEKAPLLHSEQGLLHLREHGAGVPLRCARGRASRSRSPPNGPAPNITRSDASPDGVVEPVDHSDDIEALRLVGGRQLPAHRTAVGEQPVGQSLADDDGRHFIGVFLGAVFVLGLGEAPPLNDLDAQSGEDLRIGEVELGPRSARRGCREAAQP